MQLFRLRIYDASTLFARPSKRGSRE